MTLRSTVLGLLLVAAVVIPPTEIESADHPALGLLGDLEQATAVATDEWREWAVAAFPDPRTDRRAVLRLASASTGQVDDLQIPGVVRSLRFVPGGSTVYALVTKDPKKRMSSAFLMEVDTDSLKARKVISLPATSTDMAFHGRGETLVVSCPDELRTYLLPDFRSGPLYRVLGGNLSVDTVAGSDLVVVGKNDRAVLIDLTDPHGKDEMPVREVYHTGSPVVEVRIDDRGTAAELRTADGGRTSFQIPRESTKTASEPDEEPDPAQAAPQPTAPVAAAAATTAAGETASAAPEERPEPAPVPGETEAAAEAPTAKPTPEQPPSPTAVETPAPAPATATAAKPGEGGLARGTITGSARREVGWVLLMGPNNLLREATRVKPDADGRWEATGLEPGSYRVVLDSGGQRQVHSAPPYQVIRVEKDGTAEVPPLEVLRVE